MRERVIILLFMLSCGCLTQKSCVDIDSPQVRDMCYSTLGIMESNASLCMEIVNETNRDFCLQALAYTKKDSALCDLVSENQRASCIEAVSQISANATISGNITSLNQSANI